MKREIKMPKMGESITSGTITRWYKKKGDFIKLDEPLFDLATDKVSSDIPSPAEGILTEVFYEEGSTVDVGIVLAIIEDEVQSEKKSIETTKVAPEKIFVKEEKSFSQKELSSKTFFTPLVRSLAKKNQIDLAKIETDKKRFTKKDLEPFLSTHKKIEPFSPMRKIIAKNVVYSKEVSPHVYSFSEVNLTHLVAFRKKYKDVIKEKYQFNLTYVPFILRSLALALKDFPRVNASIEKDNLVLHEDINLGMAVSLPNNGLIVPVIKKVNELNFLDLCFIIQELALKARENSLTLSHLEGGTFTYSNVGSFGSLMTFPIIVQPQLAIYGSGIIQERPLVEKGQISSGFLMYGSLSYDHRSIDGELGISFLERVHQYLKNTEPSSLISV